MKKKIKDNLLENTDWEQFDEENDKLDGISDNNRKIIFTKIYDNIARGKFIVKRIDYYNYILHTFDYNPSFDCYIYLDIKYRNDPDNRITKYLSKETPKKIIIKTDSGKYVFDPNEFNMLIKQYCKHADDFLAQLHDSILYSMTHREISRDYDVFKRNLNRPQTFSSTNGVDIGDSKMKDSLYEPNFEDIVGASPDFMDIYCINDGYAQINIAKILRKIKGPIVKDLLAAIASETGLETEYNGNGIFSVNLNETNVSEYDEYDYDSDFIGKNTYGENIHNLLKDALDLMAKKLYSTYKIPENSSYNSFESSDGETRWWGNTTLPVDFHADGEDFAKTDICDKMWHAIYHVLEDNDLLSALTADESIEATETVESNVFAYEAGLFEGDLVIKSLGIYWEASYEMPEQEE